MKKRKPCKECPWVVDNFHNRGIRKFSIRMGKEHNCNMIKSDDLWNVKEECACVGKNKMNIKTEEKL